MPSCGGSDTALGPDLGTIASPANGMRKLQAANDSLPLIANRNHSFARMQATNTNVHLTSCMVLCAGFVCYEHQCAKSNNCEFCSHGDFSPVIPSPPQFEVRPRVRGL